jgi:hypothetical protein
MSNDRQSRSASWIEILNALELSNPQAFNFFYHFHSLYGYPEGNFSPFERLSDIEQYSESDHERLTADLSTCIYQILSITETCSFEVLFTEKGVIAFSNK